MISAIVPTYNRKFQVTEAIDSILTQDLPILEIIIVDDGSSDGTIEILNRRYTAEIMAQRLFILRSEINLGVSAARNLAVRSASYPWIAFLDSDDIWLPNKVSRMTEMIRTQPDINWFHSNEIWLRDNKPIHQKKYQAKPAGNIFSDCLEACVVGASCVLIQKEIILEKGGFNERLEVCEDYALWLKIAAQHKIGFTPEQLVVKRAGHADQLSFKYHSMDYYRILAIIDLLATESLDPLQRDLSHQQLRKKYEILRSGFVKHENWQRYAELASVVARLENDLNH